MANKSNTHKARLVRENCQRQTATPSDGTVDCKKQGCISEAGVWSFSEDSDAKLNCHRDCKPVINNCELSKKQKRKFQQEEQKRREKIKKRNAAMTQRRKNKRPLPKKKDGSDQANKNFQKKQYNWKHLHCQATMIMPSAAGLRDHYEQLRDETIDDMLVLEDQLEGILWDKGIDVAGKNTAKLGARTGVRYVIGSAGIVTGPGVAVTEGIATVITIGDAVYTFVATPFDVYNEIQNVEELYNKKNKLIKKYSKDLKEAQEYIDLNRRNNSADPNIKKLDTEELKTLETRKEDIQEKSKKLSEKAIDSAQKNPCLRAKKCQLVTFKDSEKSKTLSSPNGCCPGQTGHHLLPKAYFMKKKGSDEKQHCPGYDPADAPCVCVEGSTQYSGTHGKMHTRQDDYAEKKIKNGQLSYQDAKKAALKSLEKTFAASGCDSACIEQQLDEYHENICGKDPLIYPVSTTKSGLLKGAEMPTPPGSGSAGGAQRR